MDLDVVVEREAELAQHAAGIGDRTRSVGQALVPVGRRAEQRLRVAGAERADDHVVHVLGVLERDDLRGLARLEPELERGRTRVCKQAFLEGLVDPGARDESSSVRRRARDEPVDPRTHFLARDHALLDEHPLQRPYARCGGRFAVAPDRVVRVVVVVVVVAHDVGSSQCSKTSA